VSLEGKELSTDGLLGRGPLLIDVGENVGEEFGREDEEFRGCLLHAARVSYMLRFIPLPGITIA
jgi:hypothetical protein